MGKFQTQREVYVYADWSGLGGPKPVGSLFSERLRGKEVFSFSYDPAWLSSEFSLAVDPDLRYYSGPQYLDPEGGKGNFGMFLDSSPDRWGRILLQRREAALARREGRSALKLSEMDYLLGGFDGHRMGGLRFKTNPDGAFLDDDEALACPPWSALRELEEVSLRLEEEGVDGHPEYIRWLGMLVAPGSSLGGARPKAGVLDVEGRLWLAKFPSRRDASDMGAWEMTAHALAKKAGLEVGVLAYIGKM